MSYLPEVAWSTIASNVTLGASAYRYYITVNPLDPNEAGASPMTVAINDWFIDFAGYPFLIEEVNGSILTVYDILERGDGVVSAYAPYANKLGYVYRPKNGAFLLTQAQLRKLDASAIDIITPIEKGILWKYRGIEINALYGDGEVVETIAEDSIDNITKLSLSPEFILRTEEDGWQGGKKYSLSLDGLLHNTFPDIQGTGLGDDYIHLDQDQVDALWAKDGVNITRDSAASLTGILSVDEIKSYTSALPLIKKEGNNVRISTCILSDCVNDRVGIFTETPLDHLHLTGYARISTLAETANSSLVTSNADGRLIKLPYDNNESKYLRSDGTWAVVLTSSGDFLDSVIRMVVDSTFDPGTPSNGDRYIILNAASIHTNFGAINKFSDGSALVLGNNDIVQYYSTHSEFRIVYDTSAAMQPATVTVGTDKNGNINHQWTYNVIDDIWVDRGAAASHNSLDGLNDGDYQHLTATQYTNFISLTDGSDVSNTLHNHNTLYAIKQSSTTDTTSGRGMVVGAFGLGSTILYNANNPNTLDAIGQQATQFFGHYQGDAPSDTPFAGQGVGFSVRISSSYIGQLWLSPTHNKIYHRRYSNGTWYNNEIYHSANLNIQGVWSVTGSNIYYSTGNVLVGTSSDNGNKLYVNGTGYFGGDITTYNQKIIAASAGGSRTIELNRSGSTFGTTGFRDWMIKANEATSIQIIAKINNVETILSTLTNGGNYYTSGGIGISKTSITSGYVLDTNGSVMVNGNIVATGGLTAGNKLYLGTTTPPVTDTGTLNALVWDNTTGEVKQRAITGGSGTPGGLDTYVQFNDGGTTFGGDDGLTYNKTTNDLTCTGYYKGKNIETNTTTLSTVVGMNAGLNEDKTSARYNAIYGCGSGQNIATGLANSYFGGRSGLYSTGSYCTGVGYEALFGTIGNNCTAVGARAGGQSGKSVAGAVYYGYYAGYYETGSNKLFIDNQNRTDEATARTDSIIYGVMNSTASSQELYLNSKLFARHLTNASKTNCLYYDTSTKEISYGTLPSGTVTSVAAGNGMNFTTITSSGSVTLGTPSALTSITTNSVTSNSHTHSIEIAHQTSATSSSTPTPTGNYKENEYYLTALAAGATFAAPSGTPVNGNTLLIRIKDNGTARTLAWNSIYRAVGVTLPTTTTASKTLYIGCIYNGTDSKWDVVSVVEQA